MIPPSLIILLSGPISAMAGFVTLYAVAGNNGLSTSSPVFGAWFAGVAFLIVLVPAAIFAVAMAVTNFDGFPARRARRPVDAGHLAVVTPIRKKLTR